MNQQQVTTRDARQPLIVAYGMGTDSTALLVGLKQRGIRPDLILFANTGGEKKRTYAYEPIIRQWLQQVGFPDLITVQHAGVRVPDTKLEEELLRLGTLPAICFGGNKTCSLKWKVEPQNRYVRKWQPAMDWWATGERCIKIIGYDAGPKDSKRCDWPADEEFELWYPLREWGWARERCMYEIARAGLPQPGKSACKFCGACKQHEIDDMYREEPESLNQAIVIEDRGMSSGKVKGIKGLGRWWSWRGYATEKGFRLPVLGNVN